MVFLSRQSTVQIGIKRGSMGTNHQKVAINEGDNASLPLFVPSHEFDNGGNDLLVYQFSDPIPSCDVISGTQPCSFFYKDKEFPLDGKWRRLFYCLCDFLAEIDVEKLKQTAQNFTAKYFSLSNEGMIAPKLHPSGVWINQNVSARGSVRYSRRLADEFGIPLEDFKVTFQPVTRNKKDKSDKCSLSLEIEHDVSLKHKESVTGRIQELKRIMLENFPSGFVFSASSIKLLENAWGKECSKTDLKELKRLMIKRSDDVCLFPELIANMDVCAQIKARVETLLKEHGMFSVSILYNEFACFLRELIDTDKDFRLFLQKVVLPNLKKRAQIIGSRQRQLLVFENVTDDDAMQSLTIRVRNKLEECGDAVLFDDLISEFPYLDSSVMEVVLNDCIQDVIEIKNDDLQYWKLLESFCLPTDFADKLSAILAEMEGGQVAPSLQVISDLMSQQYGNDFREIYAIDDDDVFKQIVIASLETDEYSWNRNVLIKPNLNQEINVVDEFLQTRKGVFNEEEFFVYAKEYRGLTNKGMLVLTFLRNKCIRLDRSHWVGIDDFNHASNFSNEIAKTIETELVSLLGANPFLPLGKLPDAFLSGLPTLTLGEQEFYWNHYLLTSIIVHKVPGLRCINDEPSPYTVTAMLIPTHVNYNGDVLDYIFTELKNRFYVFSSAEEVFDYLKSNQIRMIKTKKLTSRVKDFWGYA